MAEEISPLTGLPRSTEGPAKSDGEISPLTGKKREIATESSSYEYTPTPTAQTNYTYNYSDKINRYQDYGVPLRQNVDWDEYRAQRQSNAEKWGRGLTKAVVTTVGAVADNTIGVLSGIGEAIYQQDLTKLYDNSVGRGVDKMNAYMQDNFANYYTKAEQEAEGLAALGYANFWADKAANGFGYALGSIGTLLLTGGTGLATRGLGLLAKGSRYYKAAKLISTGTVGAGRLKGAANAGRALNALQTAEIGMMMSYGESAVESRETLHRVTENLMERRAEELGINIDQLPASEISQIRQDAAHAGNMAFALNMGVLSATNIVTFGKAMLPKYTQMRPGIRGMGPDAKTGKIVDFWKDNPKWGAVDRYFKNPIRGGVSETFQEGTQFAIQDAADRVSTNVGQGSVVDWIEALGEGYGETYNTKEGKESMMLGAIIGMVMGGFGSVREYMNSTEVDKQRESILNSLNNDKFDQFLRGAKSAVVSEEYAQEMQSALEAGDHKRFRDMQFRLMMEQVKFHEERGSLDMFVERLDDAQKMEDSEFAEAIGIGENVKFDKTAIISGLKDRIKDYRKLKEQVDAAFPSRSKQGIDRLVMSKEQKEAEKETLAIERQYKEYMLEHGLDLADADSRVENLANELNEGASVTLDPSEFSSTGPILEVTEMDEDTQTEIRAGGQLSQETLDKLDKIVEEEDNPQRKAELKEKVRDIKRIARDRQITISALNELYGDPESRSLYVAAQEAKKGARRMQKADDAARTRMKDTTTLAELESLEDALKTGTSPQMKAELQAELTKRGKQLTRLVREYKYSSVKELEAKLKNETDPAKLEAIREAIKQNNEEGNPGGRSRPEDTTESESKKTAAEKAKEQEERRGRNEENEGDPVQGEITPNESGEVVSIANGEFRINLEAEGANKPVVVDSKGNLIPGNDTNMAPEGVTVNRAKSQEEGFDKKSVEFRLLEGPRQAVAALVDGEVVGILSEESAKKVRPRLIKGEAVTGTVEELVFNNFINTVNEAGEKVMRPAQVLSSMDGFVQYAVVRGNELGLSEETEEGLAAKAFIEKKQRELTRRQKFTPGQVVALFKKPTGEYTAIPVSTRKAGAEGEARLAQMIKEGQDIELIKDAFGIAHQPGKSRFIVQKLADGRMLVSFELEDGRVISYNAQEFNKLMDNKPAAFTVGRFVETPDENGYVVSEFVSDGDVDPATRAEIAASAKAIAVERMQNVRVQIDQEAMSDEAYRAQAERNDLVTDVAPGNANTPFFDPIFKIKIDGGSAKQAVQEVKTPVKEQNPPTARTEESAVPDADTEYSEDDLFGAPTETTDKVSEYVQKVKQLDELTEGIEGAYEQLEIAEEASDRAQLNAEIEQMQEEWTTLTGLQYPQRSPTLQNPDLRYDYPRGQFPPGGTPSSTKQAVQYKNNTYVVDLNAGTITNEKSGKTIKSTSSVGAAVLKLVDFDASDKDDYTDLALRLGERNTTAGKTEAAKKFLQERFGEDSVSIFNTMQMIGNAVVHGYMQNGAVHLWNNAEVGTEYHEGFHMFFRTMLSDQQRADLYKDAVEKYGEPTAEQVKAALRGQQGLTDAEARELAIEERIAEEFRFYMLNEQEVERTLPQRIVKFFKDMMAYIKAVVSEQTSVNQAFSLLQKNRIPKKFLRNAKAFSPGKAFMLKQYAANPQMHTELIDIAVYNAVNAMAAGANESDLLGSQITEDESEVRNWFLRHSMHKPGGLPMSDIEFADLLEAYGTEQIREVIQRIGLRPGAPLNTERGDPMPLQIVEDAAAARHFRSVYDRWFDVEGELGGTKLRGFRSEVADRLKTYGFDPKSKEQERIYSLSRMRENPANKLNEKTKRMLSRIPVSNTESTYFGFQTYVPIMDVYTELAGSVYDSPNIDAMLERLEIRSKNIPYLRDVYNFVNNLSDQEKALFYSSLSLTMNEFRMVIIDSDAEGRKQVRIFNPGATSIESFYADKWKTKSRGPGGMYSMSVEEGVPSTEINQDKKRRAQAFLKTALSETGAAAGDAQYNALANGLWEMGIELGATKEEARDNVKKTFEDFGPAKWTRFMSEKGANIRELLNDLESGKDIHTESSGRVRVIADTITKNFVATPALSFVNGAGSLIFPLNQKTDLDITKEMIQSGEYAEMMDGSIGHTAGEVKSFATMLVSNERFQSEFVPVDFDSLKTVDANERADIYENADLTFEQALAVEMNMFRNPSNPDVLYIPLDTQGDRDRWTFIPIPNFLNETRTFEAKYNLGMAGMSKKQRIRKILTDQILVDLNRINEALSSPGDIKLYHDGRFRDLQTGGRLENDKVARQAAVYAEDPSGVMPEELSQFIDAEITRVAESVNSYKQEVIDDLGGLGKFKSFLLDSVPGVPVEKAMEFLEDYLTTNIIGRMVSREIFRSGINYVDTSANYNKRSAHTTTPGTVLMMQRKEGGYGMKPTFTEMTVQDIKKSLTAEELDSFQDKLVDQVGEDRANQIIESFSDIETTDAQAFITLDMYRSIRQGMGLWTDANEDMYNSGKWTEKLKPLKPSYEFRVEHNGHLIPVMHKNSYIVLTDELTQDIPALKQLHDRMLARGKFEGLEKVDVVNTATAKKLATFRPIDGTSEGALREAPVQTLDSRGLKLPQILPETFKDLITFGRQPRKNMIANIDDNTMYTFNGEQINGAELKQMYQSALVAKLELNKQRIFTELGYDKVLNTEGAERIKAVQAMLPKLRDKMKALGVEKDYPQNFLDALELTKDANGNLTTRIPLTFPSVHSKLDQLVLGLFRTEVYQQKLAGQEMVQFSEFGDSETGDDLSFYKVEGENILEAEVDIHPAVLKKMGVDTNQPIEEINKQVQRLLGYRIPQQGKSSMLVMKIRRLLPESAVSSVRVPTGITTMMGSDFDLDKLFVIFPELEKGQRVEFDLNQDPSTMTEKQLNNMIFETFAAVGTNVAHLGEILGGVEIGDIMEARIAIGKTRPDIDINSPVQRIQTGIDNMLSGALRGIYANAIAGRNVAQASGVAWISSLGRELIVDGKKLDRLVDRSPFTGVFTDQYMSQYLSAAVDSVKDPLQEQINDNRLTASLTTYMLSMGMTPRQAVAFLNIPSVREVVEQARAEGISLGRALGKLNLKVTSDAAPVAVGGEMVKDATSVSQVFLNTEEMLKIVKGEKIEYDERAYVSMLQIMHDEAQALDNLYKMLTPDAIDKAGTTQQHLALLDRARSLEDGQTFGGPAALREVTEGDAYPIAKAYYTAIEQSLDVGRAVGFISNQPGVEAFKQQLKGLLDMRQFNEQQHRDINRAILHHLVTMKGSPLYESGLLDASYVELNHFLGGLDAAFNEAKEANGNRPNAVLDSLEVVTEPLEDGRTFSYLRVDPSKVRTKLEKDIWTATMEGMAGNPAYSAINNALISNLITTSGFAPGPYAAFDLIPVSMFDQLGVTSHLNTEMKKLNQGGNYLQSIGFAEVFMSNYGTHRIGKVPLIDNTAKVDKATLAYYMTNGVEQKERVGKYLVVKQGKDKHLFHLVGSRYMPTLTKGRQYMFYESNLRNKETGETFNKSLMYPKKGPSPDTVGSPSQSRVGMAKSETPLGAQAKIKRLTEVFAAAGIDVRVEQGQLPMGVKGQVVGNVITLDPSQMGEDTVYHEFGHILVDLLPENEVRKYVQQVVKADPQLARMIKAKYPELDGLELGKEILVTAIGLEGAKIERKNPSKLQRIVNKILRAIGKVFGVQPNAAAVLAEQMFGNEIQAERLSGEFNRNLRNSRELRDELTTVSEDTLKSLKRQKIRLENLPESEKNKERLREISTLERNILKIQKREDELNSFMDFADYAFARINKLAMLMEKARLRAKEPTLTKAEKLELLREIGEMKETLDSLYNTRSEKSTLNKMRNLLRTTKFENATDETAEQVFDLLRDLSDTLDLANDLNEEFSDLVLPLVADTILTYADTSINDRIDTEIARLRETKDISGYGRRAYLQSNPEHGKLRRQLKAGEITKEEFREKALDLKIEDLKKQRVGREQLIAEMRDAHTSKHWFSHMMDPMIYSNEANLQLFSLAIKDAINNATEDTRGFLYELEEKYMNFKAFQGSDINEAEFNEAFLTTVAIGGMEQLSLVSEYDTQKYYGNLEAEHQRLNRKYKVPEEREDYDGWKYDEKSGKLSQAYRDHRRELIIWYKNNTDPAPKAQENLAKLQGAINALQLKIDVEEDRDTKNIMITEVKDLEDKLYRSYSRTGVFMEELAVPKKYDGSGGRLYASEKFERIQSTPELKEYYDFIVDTYEQSQKKIGKSQLFINSWDTMSYIMPTVRKDRLAALQQEGWRDLVKEAGRDFTRLDTDTQFGMMTEQDGERIKSVPRFYTNRVQARDVSRDIAASMAQFTHMANMFEKKGETVGLVESMMSIHEQRKTIPTDSKTGLPIIDKVSQLARGVQEGTVEEDPRNNRGYQHLKEYIDSVFYGQLDIDQGAVLGVDVSKLAGKAAAFTAITNLAFNTLQVGNQFVLDNLMGSEEAVAGQFFGKKDFAWAVRMYLSNKGALSDLGAFVPKSKLGQAMMMFDALNEVTDNIGQGVSGNKLKKTMQSDPLFAMQHAIEHQSTGTRMLALLRSYKGKLKDSKGNVLLNERGEEADLWDMLTKDKKGKFIIDPRVANVQKNEVIAKLHGINKRANQIKGTQDRSMGNRRAIGKLALLFRNYFVPGLRKRFGHGQSFHVDYELGDVTRGMYQSFMGYLSLIPYEGVTAFQMMSETDKQNLKRITYEAMSTAVAMTVYMVTQAMLDDDDEDDNYMLAYTSYQARRLQSELLQFLSPGEFLRMAQSPMATVNWLEKYATVISQVLLKEPGYQLGVVDEDDIFYQRRTATAEKGDRKVIAQMKKIIPVLNGYQTSFLREGSAQAVEEKLRWFS